MDKRRVLLIALAVLLVIIVVGWIFFLLRGQTAPDSNNGSLPITPGQGRTTPSPQGTVVPATFEKISDKWILSPRIQDNTVLGFDLADSKLKAYSLILKTAQEKSLSNTTFAGISAAAWAPDNTQVIFKYRDERNRQTLLSVFDLRQSLSYALDGFTKEAAWAPDGTRLVIYKELPHQNSFSLATIKPDGSDEQKLVELRLSDPKLQWPSANQIVIYPRPVQQQATEKIFTYDLENKILSELSIPVYQVQGSSGLSGLELLFSPDGKKILVSYTSQDNRSLLNVVYDTEKEFDPAKEETASVGLTNLPFATLVSKCAWASDSESLYCAYPNPVPSGDYLWPFDYWLGKASTRDSFAKFNWRTGEFKIYGENTEYDAVSLDLARNESFLTFVNRKDLGLYRLKL